MEEMAQLGLMVILWAEVGEDIAVGMQMGGTTITMDQGSRAKVQRDLGHIHRRPTVMVVVLVQGVHLWATMEPAAVEAMALQERPVHQAGSEPADCLPEIRS
jgi:hypothetical protein